MLKGVIFSRLLIKLLLKLFNDFRNNARTNGSAAFTNSETETFFHSDGGYKLNIHFDVVAGHNHFYAFGKFD